MTSPVSTLSISQITQSSLSSVLVGCGVFLLCFLGILTRPGFDLATFWPANAFMLGMLVRYPSLAGPLTWISCAAGFVLADAVTGAAWITNLVLNGGNLLSIATGYALFARMDSQDRSLRRPMSVFYLLGAVLCASLMSGMIGSVADPVLFGGTSANGFLFWFVTEMVNFTAFLPLLLTFPDISGRSAELLKTRLAGVGLLDVLPLVFLVASAIAGVLIGGPGAVAFPVPALLWCALTYNIFTTACLSFCFGAWTLLSLRTGLLPIGMDFNSRPTLLSARVGVTLVSLGPLVVASVMAARAELLERLRHLADSDQMTGLRNRRSFMEQGKALLSALPDRDHQVAIMMLDIDHFKSINDRYGHAAGDQVISAFARTLQRNVRPQDTLGRIGGEEFAILLSDCTLDEATAMAERINALFRSEPVRIDTSNSIFATVSIGIHVGHERCLDRLLALADAALYRAKELGRNRFEVSLLHAAG